MERNREGWYEREEIKKITLDWVKENVKLTEREKELLQLISDRRLVRRDHLEIISPTYRKLGVNKTVLLNRAIKKMYKCMVLDKAHEKQEIGKGSYPSIVAIDKAGSLYLGKKHKRRIIQRSTTYKGNNYITRSLPSNFRHINGVNKLEVETILLCEQYGYEVLEWEIESPKQFTYGNEDIVLIPDVLMVLDINGNPFSAFIEYDTGSEGIREKEPKVIRDKISKYKKYKSSKLWADEKYQKHFVQPTFPLLLFVTADDKRIEFVKKKAEEYNIKSLSIYSDKYSDVLERLTNMIRK